MRKTSVLFVCMIALVAFAAWAPNAEANPSTSSCVGCHTDFAGGSGSTAHQGHLGLGLPGSCNACHINIGDTPPTPNCGDCHVQPGLPVHHETAGAASCVACHPGTPAPENTAVFGYQGLTVSLNPCDGSEERFASFTVSLDNDGDGLYDGNDPDCGPAPECIVDADCDNGLFCDGAETCNAAGACVSGTAPCDPATETCDEAQDTCVPIQTGCTSDAECDDGAFCNGDETCNLATGECQAGTAPCDPNTQTCDDVNDQCVPIQTGCTSDADCDDGAFCNGDETCDLATGECQAGTAPCDSNTQTCDDVNDQCVPIQTGCTSDAECDNGDFCDGDETCDLATGACVAGTAPCDPATETCDEANDLCVAEPDKGPVVKVKVKVPRFINPKDRNKTRIKLVSDMDVEFAEVTCGDAQPERLRQKYFSKYDKTLAIGKFKTKDLGIECGYNTTLTCTGTFADGTEFMGTSNKFKCRDKGDRDKHDRDDDKHGRDDDKYDRDDDKYDRDDDRHGRDDDKYDRDDDKRDRDDDKYGRDDDKHDRDDDKRDRDDDNKKRYSHKRD